MTARARLLLVGAGHAHLHLIRHAEALARWGYDVTLVAPRWFDYSGAAVAVAVGTLEVEQARIDVAALTRERLIHHQGLVRTVDVEHRTATTDGGSVLEWDVISFNVGSAVRAGGDTGDGIGVKPLAELHRLRDQLIPGRAITVVGGGPSGVELAAQLAAHPSSPQVRLLERGPRILPTFPPAAARRVEALLIARGVEVRVGDDAKAGSDLTLWATGLQPPPFLESTGLGGPHGIPVRQTLQHPDHDDVYAVGDCADFLPGRLPRIGVHGVRQGPVLLAALQARLEGAAPPRYRPQSRALSILDLGDGTGLAARGRLWWCGGLSLRLKRLIDRRWIDGARSRPPAEDPTPDDAADQ